MAYRLLIIGLFSLCLPVCLVAHGEEPVAVPAPASAACCCGDSLARILATATAARANPLTVAIVLTTGGVCWGCCPAIIASTTSSVRSRIRFSSKTPDR